MLVLDPTAPPGPSAIEGQLDHESPGSHAGDHGYGGIALCVHDVRSDGAPTIFLGTMATDVTVDSQEIVSSLQIYERLPLAPGLQLVQETVFDGTGGNPKLFGLCGLAAGSLNPAGGTQLVLTTLAGDLVVYDWFCPVATSSSAGCGSGRSSMAASARATRSSSATSTGSRAPRSTWRGRSA